MKVGDRVKCVTNEWSYSRIAVGAEYTITRKVEYSDTSSCVWFNDNGPYQSTRFVLVETASMSLNAYQEECMRTAGDRTGIRPLAMGGLGIAGEAGEVADHIKKHLFHGHPLDKDAVKKELGDVMWYVASVGDACELTLEEIASANIEKLRKRYPDGFSVEASLNRVDVKDDVVDFGDGIVLGPSRP